MFSLKAALLGLFFAQANGHFLLNYPTTIGFNDDDEGTAPCGGFQVSFDNATNFYAGGDIISLTSIHPAANWLFRATLDPTASGNWTALLPAIAQVGQGNFCEQGVRVPPDWAGKKGVLQIAQDAIDGILYQCATVNFVSGTAPSVPAVCTNVTGISASFTTDPALSAIPGGASPTTSASKTSSASAVREFAAGSLFWAAVMAFGSVVAAFAI